jgi:hypothetical protein
MNHVQLDVRQLLSGVNAGCSVTEAIIGFVGVVIGAIVSGGATYVMTRRSERQKARAAARLLESNMLTIEAALQRVLDLNPDRSPNAWVNVAAPAWWSDVLRNDVRVEHRPLLAEVLGAGEWYDLSRAYAWIEQLARIRVGVAEVRIPWTDVAEELDRVRRGIRAVERLTEASKSTYPSRREEVDRPPS